MDAVALVRAALDDLVQEHDLFVPLANGDVEVAQARQSVGQLGQLVVMRREERLCANLVVQMLDDRPRQAQAVERARAAPDLVEYDQAPVGGIVENVRRLGHLNHEGRLATRQVVARADAGEDTVHQVHPRALGRQKRAGVCQQRQQCHLPDVRAFAGHVRAGDDGDLLAVALELCVVWHERLANHRLLEHGVAALVDLQHALVAHLWANVAVQPRDLGETGQHIELRQRRGDLLNLPQRLEHLLAHALEQLVLELLAALLRA